jgi:potassium-transporting ATPase potassium-binding subunit
MVGLAVHNFTSAAAGIAVAIALVRGFARRSAKTIGNFWVDLTRATLYVLLPLSIVGALLLVSQGVIQNFILTPSRHAGRRAQTIAQGPVASQEAIKMLGTNGGGFFNANSAHPFENPTPFANFLQMLFIFVIPGGLTYTFGKMVKDTRQGWALFAAMSVLFLAGVFVVYPAEQSGNPNLTKLGVADRGHRHAARRQHGRQGGALRHRQFRAVRGGHHRRQLRRGEQACTTASRRWAGWCRWSISAGRSDLRRRRRGLYGMLMFAILAVFIAGPDGGPHARVPGQEDRAEGSQDGDAGHAGAGRQHSAVLRRRLGDSTSQEGLLDQSARSRHGQPQQQRAARISEMLYAYTSATGNNGSAFAGINANTPYFNTTIGLAMLIGRFLMMIPLLAAAGSLAQKKMVPVSAGTFPTHGRCSWPAGGVV